MDNNFLDSSNFKYTIKVLKNKHGIKKLKICKYCKLANDASLKKCSSCFSRLK